MNFFVDSVVELVSTLMPKMAKKSASVTRRGGGGGSPNARSSGGRTMLARVIS